MAGFLNKLGEMAKTAADKTGDMIEISKLNSKISAQEAVIAELKVKIGNFYWEKYASLGAADSEIVAWCEAIQEALKTIQTTQSEIHALKNESSATPPPVAPSPADPPASPVQEAVLKCPNCGTVNAEGTKFCSECGNKL